MINDQHFRLRHPNPIKNTLPLQDKHWDECIPKEIPYTIAAEKYKKKEFEGSAQVKAQLDALESKLQSLSSS